MDVVDVFFGVEVHRFVGAAVDLPPAGDALGNGEAGELPRFVFFDEPGEFRPWADEAHFSFDDVEELGKFV